MANRNTIPPEGAGARSYPLKIPSWAPQQIVPIARKLHAKAISLGHASDAQLIERLITDDRMKRVWGELHKRKRGSQEHGFYHPARPPDGFVSRTETDAQDRAIQELFIEAFTAARWSQLPDSPAPISEIVRRLVVDAGNVRSGHPRNRCLKIAKRLSDAAEAYEDWVKIAPLDHKQMVSVVKNIANLMNERFGSPKYGLTATLVSVALGRIITQTNVREWCSRTTARNKAKGTMGKKAKKRSVSP